MVGEKRECVWEREKEKEKTSPLSQKRKRKFFLLDLKVVDEREKYKKRRKEHINV
jgi:hypothetical protein